MVGTFVLNLTFFHSLLCCNHLFMPLKTLKHTDPPYIFLNLQLFLFFLRREMCCRGFPGGSAVKNLPANRGDTGQMGLIPVLGRSPGEGKGNPFQCSCLEKSMDRVAYQATVHEVAKSGTLHAGTVCY